MSAWRTKIVRCSRFGFSNGDRLGVGELRVCLSGDSTPKHVPVPVSGIILSALWYRINRNSVTKRFNQIILVWSLRIHPRSSHKI